MPIWYPDRGDVEVVTSHVAASYFPQEEDSPPNIFGILAGHEGVTALESACRYNSPALLQIRALKGWGADAISGTKSPIYRWQQAHCRHNDRDFPVHESALSLCL